VQRAVVVAIGGTLAESSADDPPLSRRDLVDAGALDHAVADEAQRHVRVLLHERGRTRLRPQPLRVEEWRPLVLATGDLGCQQLRRSRAHRKAPLTEAGRDPHP
jgi:hypothetical protein